MQISLENFIPLANNYLVQFTEVETTSASGLIIPGLSSHKYAKVIKVGTGSNDKALVAKEGDLLLLEGVQGLQELTISDNKYYLVPESKVLGVFVQ